MVDYKLGINQVRKIQGILIKIHDKGMIFPFEFKSYIKHKKREVNLKDFIIRFKVKKDNNAFTKKVIT